MSSHQGGMEYRLPSIQTDIPRELRGKGGSIRHRLPVGPIRPRAHRFSTFPVVTRHIPTELIPRIRPTVRTEYPSVQRRTQRVGTGLLHHVETVIVIHQGGLIVRSQHTLSIDRKVLEFFLQDERVIHDVRQFVIERLAETADHSLVLRVASPLRPEYAVATK